MADPWQWWPADQIARATGCPAANVAENWPLLVDALDAHGIYERDVARGVLGTVAIETASTFQPVREAYWLPESWRAANLRYYPFYGRGFDQTTWENGYREAGQFLGRDLLAQPDLLLRADLSARVTAWRFATKGVPSKDGSRFWTFAQLCRDHDWTWLRRGIQGGEAGLDRLLQIVNDLGDGTMPTPLPYNPDAPVDQQPNDWSCALQSVQWLLRSIGRNPDASDPVGDPWLMSQLVPGIISPQVGLQDASGQQLADWLNREYGAEMGFTAQAAPVTFDDVAAGAGTNPTLIGGRRWGSGGHWSGVRRADENGWLELANPAPNYTGVGTHLSREEWDARGPWSAIWIDRAGAAVEPEPVPFDRAAAAARVQALLTLHDQYDAAIRAELSNLLAMLEAA